MCRKIKQTLNNELKFHIVNTINVCRKAWFGMSLYSRINYVHSPDGELLWCVGVSGNN